MSPRLGSPPDQNPPWKGRADAAQGRKAPYLFLTAIPLSLGLLISGLASCDSPERKVVESLPEPILTTMPAPNPVVPAAPEGSASRNQQHEDADHACEQNQRHQPA
jgi:hypothetical protein